MEAKAYVGHHVMIVIRPRHLENDFGSFLSGRFRQVHNAQDHANRRGWQRRRDPQLEEPDVYINLLLKCPTIPHHGGASQAFWGSKSAESMWYLAVLQACLALLTQFRGDRPCCSQRDRHIRIPREK